MFLPFAELQIFCVTQSLANVGHHQFHLFAHVFAGILAATCMDCMAVFRNNVLTKPWEVDGGRTLLQRNTYIQGLPRDGFTYNDFKRPRHQTFSNAPPVWGEKKNLQTNFIKFSGYVTAACFASLSITKQRTKITKTNHFLVDFSNFKIKNCHTCSKPPSDCRVATYYAHSV